MPLLAALLHGTHLSSAISKSDSPRSLSGKVGANDEAEKQRRLQQQAQQQQQQQEDQARAAILTAMASQTIVRKLGSAFWEAFSGGSSSSSTVSGPRLDADKVRRVLEGSAVVKIVDVDEKVGETKGKVRVKEDEKVKESPRNLSVGGSVSMPSSPLLRGTNQQLAVSEKGCTGIIGRAVAARRETAEKGVCDILEERMSRLALGGKTESK